jgi:hypothetical protein
MSVFPLPLDDPEAPIPVRGDLVETVRGYPFPGVVLAEFQTTAGCVRVVVEARVPPGASFSGLLHIYIFSLDQLRFRQPGEGPAVAFEGEAAVAAEDFETVVLRTANRS